MKGAANRIKIHETKRPLPSEPSGQFKLPPLPYSSKALEPHIDARTMDIHHDKHHGTYVTNLNSALMGMGAERMSIEDICKSISKYPMVVRNNAGGHYNHSLLWTIMSPEGGGGAKGNLLHAINVAFGSFDDFKRQFSAAGMNR